MIDDKQIGKKNKRFSVKWLIVSALLGLVAVIVFFFIGDFKENIEAFKRIKPVWVIYSFVCLTIYWISEAFALFVTARICHVHLSYPQAFETNLMGQFYNSVTPFATGGQPMQIYRMYQFGIPVSKGTAIATSKFLIYQISITIIGIFLLLFFFKNIAALPAISGLVLIGFIINAAVIIFVIIFSFNPPLTKKIIHIFLNIVGRFKIGKKLKNNEEKYLEKLKEFHDSMKRLIYSPGKLLLALLATCIQMFFYFSISYCIYRMFENPTVSFAEIFAFQGILFVVTGFVPIPGAGGAAEGGFYLFFKSFFTNHNIVGAVIMWRIMTYYMNIFFGTPFAIKTPKKSNMQIEK